MLLQDFHHIKTAAIFQAQIQNRESGRVKTGNILAFRDRRYCRDHETALSQGTGHTLHKGAIIIHDETGAVLNILEALVQIYVNWPIHDLILGVILAI